MGTCQRVDVGGRPTSGRVTVCVHTRVVKPHSDAVTGGAAVQHCQLFQHPIYHTEKVLVKFGHFPVELTKVLVILKKVSGEQSPGFQQDSITRWRT